MKKKLIRWGILGLGRMAEQFVNDFKAAEGCVIAAVGSRSLEKAEAFKNRMRLPEAKAYGSYAELCADPGLDVVYVATPHPLHMENTISALQGGKAVLCEKPLAVNREQVEAMVKLAGAKKLFFMEAMWTAFLPVIRKAKELVGDGIIGRVERVAADLSYNLEWDPQDRIYNPELAGGALLDLGVYSLFIAQYMFEDKPQSIEAFAHIGTTGVDEHTVAIIRYPGARFAQVSVAVRFRTASLARIEGTKGWIHIPNFCFATALTVTEAGKEPYTIEAPRSYHYQVEEVNRCLEKGMLESTIMPLKFSLTVMEMMDTIRKQIGLRYPFEV